MFFRKQAVCVAALVLGMSGTASAQLESGGLGELDPWGVGYLASAEPSLSKSAWQASLGEDLLPLMEAVRTRNITPVERTLLRRAVLSPARAPGGERSDQLLAERARIMFELGEARAAADLLDRLDVSPEGIVAEELAVDLQFALGQVASACAKVQSPELTSDFWLKMRAVCFALEGNQPGAELAIELARASDINDEWLFSAVEASFLPDGPKPTARFDTGYGLTISVHSDLPVPINAVSYSRPHLAAAMAIRPALPPELRVLAAGVASEAGLVSPEEQLAAYEALLTQEGFRPNSPVEAALVTLDEPGSSMADRARHLASALQGARGSSARFSAVSTLLKPAIQSVWITEDTLRYAPLFAASLLATGETYDAYEWAASHIDALSAVDTTEPTETEGEDNDERPPLVLPDGDQFESLWLMGISLLGGLDIPEDEVDAWIVKLVETADSSAKADGAARLLTLLTARGQALPAEARRFLLENAERTERTTEQSALISAIQSAATSGATGEAIFYVLRLINGDPEALHAQDLLTLTAAMADLGLGDLSDDLLLEAMGLWKESL